MRASPLHHNPQVTPFAERIAAQERAAGPAAAPPQGGGSAGPGSVPGPGSLPEQGVGVQPVVDYAAVRLIKREVGERLTSLLRASPRLSAAAQEQQGRALINEQVAIWSDAEAVKRGTSTSSAEDAAIAQAVFDLQFRAGRLQAHLDNPAVENIFINGYTDAPNPTPCCGSGRPTAKPPVIPAARTPPSSRPSAHPGPRRPIPRPRRTHPKAKPSRASRPPTRATSSRRRRRFRSWGRPLTVSGITHSGHGPKVAALAALIHLRPGRTAEFLCTAMDPVNPWSTRTLQTRLSEIRSRLGAAPDGQPYLPRPKHGYSFHPDVTSDWRRFQDLATRGLADPQGGTGDLENALALLRGKPFEGRDFSWADAVQQEMISRIVDTAHTLAVRHTEGDEPDLDAARRAALRGLEIDETAEVLYRDWMNIEWGAGNTAGVRKAIARLQQVARTYDISLEPVTEQLIDLVLADRTAPSRAGRS
ncbi:bacterial transcriptional activator domain-containing protein [Streptomyces anulatus]|uniref:AfsR/SARP family transcriptional regulator n=1 Tax=Streptomyces anulatus TaxID=1892 RepID=UPI0032433BEA